MELKLLKCQLKTIIIILKFENFHKQQAVPFVIYADFEAITERIQRCQPVDNKSYTEAYQKHKDCFLDTRLYMYVVMMINTANRYKFLEVKRLCINLWKKCLKKSIIAKK